MEHAQVATPAPAAPARPHAGALDADAAAAALAQACIALWTATLSLMAAFMQTGAPVHRVRIARKIAGNFELLREQDCFTKECRQSFSALARRWATKAEQLQRQQDRPNGGFGQFLPVLFGAR